MSDVIRISVRISTQKVGSECEDEIEVARDEWEAMSDKEKEELCRDTAFSMMEWNWKEV